MEGCFQIPVRKRGLGRGNSGFLGALGKEKKDGSSRGDNTETGSSVPYEKAGRLKVDRGRCWTLSQPDDPGEEQMAEPTKCLQGSHSVLALVSPSANKDWTRGCRSPSNSSILGHGVF